MFKKIMLTGWSKYSERELDRVIHGQRKNDDTCVDREVRSEERGTETNSFNAVFGAWFGARVLSQAFAPQTQFAGRPKAQAHCLALEGSPLDRPHAQII